MTLASQTGSMRERLLRDQQSGMASPIGPAALAGGVEAQAVQGQALNLQQIRPNVLPGVPAGGMQGGLGMPEANQSLRDIRNFLAQMVTLLQNVGRPGGAAQNQPAMPAGVN